MSHYKLVEAECDWTYGSLTTRYTGTVSVAINVSTELTDYEVDDLLIGKARREVCRRHAFAPSLVSIDTVTVK